MKILKIKSSLLVGLCALCTIFPTAKNSTLPQITRPYLGDYECKLATLGSQDLLENFSFISLELKPNNTFVLSYKEKDGEKKEETGKYSYDHEKQELSIELGKNGLIKRKFPLKNGELMVDFRIGTKLLVLKFEQK
jgi:hypothetical protein